jgi:hypothetical protein
MEEDMATTTARKTAAAKKLAAPASKTAKPAKTTKATKAPAPAKKAAPRKTRPAATPAPSPAPAESAGKAKKLVRDSFTIPRSEYSAIDLLKKRAAKAGHAVKKSELLRAGLMTLVAMDDAALASAVAAVPAIKTGRPKAKKSVVV